MPHAPRWAITLSGPRSGLRIGSVYIRSARHRRRENHANRAARPSGPWPARYPSRARRRIPRGRRVPTGEHRSSRTILMGTPIDEEGAMSGSELRESVSGLMPRAKDDLAELVAFRSVADPRQYPAEECERAARWVRDAFAEAGLEDAELSRTPDGSLAVHGSAAGPPGTPTVLLYSHYDVQPPLGEDALDEPGVRADRARRPLVRTGKRRLQGQHRHAADGAARPAPDARRIPLRDQGDLRRLRGAGDRWPGGVRPGSRRAAACRHDPDLRHRQLRRRACRR